MFHWFKKHTKDGLELPDETPIEVPLSEKPLTIHEQIQRFVHDPDVQAIQRNNGIDTFDEADDFDIDEVGPVSPYEYVLLEDEEPIVQTRMDEIRSGLVLPQDESRVNKVMEKISKKKVETKQVIDEKA